jgi:threonine dehydratase
MVQQETCLREASGGVLAGIGNTPLVELRRVVPTSSARVLMKLEWVNPTGSMRIGSAKAATEAAESDGLLTSGGTVVEYTAGTTGISLAPRCVAKGYNLEIVSPMRSATRSVPPCRFRRANHGRAQRQQKNQRSADHSTDVVVAPAACGTAHAIAQRFAKLHVRTCVALNPIPAPPQARDE